VLVRETADSVIEPGLELAVQAARLWSPAAERDALLTSVADTCLTLTSDGGSRRVVALRALAGTATTEQQLRALQDLAGDDIDLGWRTLTRLAALGRVDPGAVVALEERDPDPEAWVRAALVDAARPDPDAKGTAWTLIMDKRQLPSGSLRDAGQAFWQPGQAELLAPFADRYLDALPALGEAGMLAVMGMVSAMFPVVGVDAEFVDRVTQTAARDDVSPMMARRLQEQADRLQRMLRARG
jgi:aminopeptidase N